jgi:hypothetical protein
LAKSISDTQHRVLDLVNDLSHNYGEPSDDSPLATNIAIAQNLADELGQVRELAELSSVPSSLLTASSTSATHRDVANGIYSSLRDARYLARNLDFNLTNDLLGQGYDLAHARNLDLARDPAHARARALDLAVARRDLGP